VGHRFGIWLSVRIDARDAADLCEMLIAEVESWRTTPRD
jgi:hypothetical protein